MICELNIRVYNKNKICILDEIEIDQSGMCDSCEIVSIPEKLLENEKEKRLKIIFE